MFKLVLSFLMIISEKTSLVSGDSSSISDLLTFLKLSKGFRLFGRSLVPSCTISISGLDGRMENLLLLQCAVLKALFCGYCSGDSTSLVTKIFHLIWLLLDCCFDDLMVEFLCFDIVAAFKWEVSVSLSPTESWFDVLFKFLVAIELSHLSVVMLIIDDYFLSLKFNF